MEARAIVQRPELILSRDLSARGLGAVLRSEVRRGRLEAVRRGVYTDATESATRDDAERYLARIEAVLSTRSDAIVTSYSAAAVLGLPMIGAWPREVYLLSPTSSSRRRNGVIEIGRNGTEEIIELGGILMTTIPQSLTHICKTAGFMAALAMVDAAIHRDRFDHTVPLTAHDELWARWNALQPFAGSRRMKCVLEKATTLADGTFETASRVAIDELGFPEPMLQHRLYLPRSAREVFLNFAWPEYRVAGEADGQGKYLGNEAGQTGDPARRVLAEKRRENEFRGLKWSVGRWEWDDMWRRTPLKGILIEAGLPVVRRPRSYV